MSTAARNGTADVGTVARKAHANRICVVPVAENGSKRPGVPQWKRFQTERPTDEMVADWWGEHHGLGFITGAVSGNLELFEFDDAETYFRFIERSKAVGLWPLVERIEQGYCETTPGDGVHWLYRCDVVAGNTKLAEGFGAPDANGKPTVQVLIETRGEGGFVIVAPSRGPVHPTGGEYHLLRGGVDTIPTITPEERENLWALARSFDGKAAPKAEDSTWTITGGGPGWREKPGDAFNQRASWEQALPGWTKVGGHGDVIQWRRPGKDHGISATTNYGGSDVFYPFTTSSEFTAGRSYTKFGVYTLLEHRGDFKAATLALFAAGFGEKEPEQAKANGKAATPPPAVAYGELDDAALGLIPAASIAPEAVEYVWRDRIAVGRLALVLGDGGDGKSQLLTAEIAAVSRGGRHVDGSGPATPGDCLILAAEDGASDTIIPRLRAADADLSRVTLLTARLTLTEKGGKHLIHPQSFQDLGYWREVLTRRPGARLLVADPLPAYLGRGVNDHRNNEVRAVLEPFIALLDELRIALVGVTHVGKTIDARTPAHRALGSVAYSNLARTVHATAKDPDDKDRRIVMHVKNNLGPLQPALAYRIKEHVITYEGQEIRTSRLEFEDKPVDVDPDEVMSGSAAKRRGPQPKKTSAAAEWLFDWLKANGQAQPLGAIFDAAGAAGLIGERKPDGKWSTVANLYNAQKAIPGLPEPRNGCEIETHKSPFRPGGRDVVWWRLVGENAKPVEATEEATPWDVAF